MKNIKIHSIIVLVGILAFFISCEKTSIAPASNYNCTVDFQDNSISHPKAVIYQEILERNRKAGLVGAALLVKDESGLWMSANGKADITADVDLQLCNPFFIASISKLITATCVMTFIEEGILNLEDPISKWLPNEIIKEVSNAEEAQIVHLLAHTSGIIDFYTITNVLDNINNDENNWTQEDILAYTYGKKATNAVGERHEYSNTNYLLLGMIMENASNQTLETIYQERVFNPLNLTSAYYSATIKIPSNAVKGYSALYKENQFIETTNFYIDDLGIGGDGGVLMNIYDLWQFVDNLLSGNIVSESTLANMKNLNYGFGDYGLGFEEHDINDRVSIGHGGSIVGFNNYLTHYPERNATMILLTNSDGNNHWGNIIGETLDAMAE